MECSGKSISAGLGSCHVYGRIIQEISAAGLALNRKPGQFRGVSCLTRGVLI
ncbi:hypothetical protein D3OALGA1CA_1041 [Olavius algarvensis associated proteobacterium Delta 3]|nr:hypothetical protein D3OALGA1CA_1041 [Olavius algarvensis associated proteobacterium Delta 3]CAB5130985.1 hypothetical protein D3OALGB2SA_3631 [Olavius algarvensis associated proteobacterium Delta 3]